MPPKGLSLKTVKINFSSIAEVHVKDIAQPRRSLIGQPRLLKQKNSLQAPTSWTGTQQLLS